LPYDELEAGEPAVEPLGQVVCVNEIAEMAAELVMATVVISADCVLQRAVHPADLTGRPRVVRPNGPVLDTRVGADELEGCRSG
jgi:hypothetical protein